MITPEPVPEGLVERALDTAFTAEEWPEWDDLDLVPDIDEPGDPDSYDLIPDEPAETEATDDDSTDDSSLDVDDDAHDDAEDGPTLDLGDLDDPDPSDPDIDGDMDDHFDL